MKENFGNLLPILVHFQAYIETISACQERVFFVIVGVWQSET